MLFGTTFVYAEVTLYDYKKLTKSDDDSNDMDGRTCVFEQNTVNYLLDEKQSRGKLGKTSNFSRPN